MLALHSAGGSVVAVGYGPETRSSGDSAPTMFVLGPDDGSWRPIRPPVDLDRRAAAWTGEELVVLGGSPTPFGPAAAVAYDPAEDRWRTLPSPPDDLTAEALAVAWDGRRLVVTNYSMAAATYDPAADRWEALPDVPARFYEHQPTTTSAGGATFTRMALALARLDGNRWVPYPADTLPQSLISLGDDESAAAAAWLPADALSPARLAILNVGAMLDASRTRQVGVAAIELGSDDVDVSSSYDRATDAVEVVVAMAEGGRCTVRSTYLPGGGSALTVAEEIDGPDGPHPWTHDEAGRTWRLRADDSDQVDLACDQASAARRLAATVDLRAPTN